MLRAQIDNDRDSVGGSGILEVTFRPLSFVEHRTFAKRSHVKHRKVFDMTYIGSTRVVDQASAHSLPLTVAGRHIALAVAGRHGSNRRERLSGLSPGPVSRTPTDTPSGSLRVLMSKSRSSSPTSRIASIALMIKLSSTCCS